MNEVKVTNVGNRIRNRLGYNFQPKQEVALSVNNRQLLTLRAVKDFKVVVLEPETKADTDDGIKVDAEVDEKVVEEQELNYSELNMEQVLKAVEDGKIDLDEAIAKEVSGKNRATLLDKLKDIKK